MIAESLEVPGLNVAWAEDGGDCPENPATEGITGDREDLIAWLMADSQLSGCTHYTVLSRNGGFTIWRR
jgi:hypothetical protein